MILICAKIFIIKIVSNLIKLFWIIPLKKRVLFISYNGKQFSDSPKCVYEEMLNANHDYELVWAFYESSCIHGIENLKFVKKGTLHFLVVFCSSSHVIVNDSIDSYLPVRKKQLLINTWHGGGWFKKVGLTSNEKTAYDKWFFKEICSKHTFYTASSEYFVDTVLHQSFGYDGKILRTGMPRNAIFFQNNIDYRNQIRFKFIKNQDCLIVLYAPTFRSYNDEIEALDMDNLAESLLKKTGKSVVILYRAHHLINEFKVDDCKIINVTKYPDMQELLLACDVLVSDYSSCMWEGAIQHKLVITYAPDAQKYVDNRGFFLDISKWPFLICFSNEQVSENIENFNEESYHNYLNQLLTESNSYENVNSAKAIVDTIIKYT